MNTAVSQKRPLTGNFPAKISELKFMNTTITAILEVRFVCGFSFLRHSCIESFSFKLRMLQRFSELYEKCRVLSHQMLTGRTDRSETALEIMNDHAHQ